MENEFNVALEGSGVLIHAVPHGVLSRYQAQALAAWLYVLSTHHLLPAVPDEPIFAEIVEDLENELFGPDAE